MAGSWASVRRSGNNSTATVERVATADNPGLFDGKVRSRVIAASVPSVIMWLLMLGMAVDANILIYERLREERERGAGLPLAMRNGYDRALPTISTRT